MTEKQFFVLAGNRFKRLRESKSITQLELSGKTGIDQALISKFENHGKKISTFRIKQLLEAIGHSLADLEIDPGSETAPEKKTPSISISPCLPVMA